MAKRRKHTKTTHRRRRVSGVGKINPSNLLVQLGGVAVGAAAAGFFTSKVLGKQSATVKAVAAIAAGIATPMFIKSDLGKAAGNGMIAVGVIALLKKSGMVSGLGASDIMIPVAVSGADDYPVISGDYAMAGDDGMSGDYAMAGEDDGMSGTDDLSVIGAMEDF